MAPYAPRPESTKDLSAFAAAESGSKPHVPTAAADISPPQKSQAWLPFSDPRPRTTRKDCRSPLLRARLRCQPSPPEILFVRTNHGAGARRTARCDTVELPFRWTVRLAPALPVACLPARIRPQNTGVRTETCGAACPRDRPAIPRSRP